MGKWSSRKELEENDKYYWVATGEASIGMDFPRVEQAVEISVRRGK